MTVEAAIRAVASSQAVADVAVDAWKQDEAKLNSQGINNDKRKAMLIGQCAHESARFVAVRENLNYSAKALRGIFRKYFPTDALANQYARKPEKIANRVYADRMGNGSEASGDGWKYRGRGYLQLTGASNYKLYGAALGIDLLGDPEQASKPAVSWQIAARYCATRKRSGRTLLEWADDDDWLMVTKGINGGTHGLQDRINLTEKALGALSGAVSVIEQQRLLADAGFDPGVVDGLMGKNTRRATAEAVAKLGVEPPTLWDRLRELG